MWYSSLARGEASECRCQHHRAGISVSCRYHRRRVIASIVLRLLLASGVGGFRARAPVGGRCGMAVCGWVLARCAGGAAHVGAFGQEEGYLGRGGRAKAMWLDPEAPGLSNESPVWRTHTHARARRRSGPGAPIAASESQAAGRPLRPHLSAREGLALRSRQRSVVATRGARASALVAGGRRRRPGPLAPASPTPPP